MTNKFYKQDQPIVIGLSGKAGTGKTVTAETLVPGAMAKIDEDFWWDHKFFAMPLYELARIRLDAGDDRMKHNIHNTLFDLFSGCDKPLKYKELIELTLSVAKEPIEQDRKPRSFLQNVGTMCRDVRKDCYTSFLYRSIIKGAAWAKENDREYVCVVSDVRMPNEAKMVQSFNNGVVVQFTASENIRKERIYDRDGYLMSEEQANHVSEKTDAIKDKLIDMVIDTDNLTIAEQADAVITTMNTAFEFPLWIKSTNAGVHA